MQLEGYQVNERMHVGGWYELYRAVRLSDQRDVVLKAITDNRPSPAMLESLQTEFEVLQQLNHPAIVNVLALEKFGRRQVLVREYCHGIALQDYLAGQVLALNESCRLMLVLCEIVESIHSQAVVHGNLNTDNLLIASTGADLKLLGFTYAKPQAQLNNSNFLFGLQTRAINYLAPEQSGRMNRPVDSRADIYALGVIFYQLLTGQLPFSSVDALSLVHSHMAKAVPDPRQLRTELPAVLSQIVQKMLAKDPDERYASVSALLTDLSICHAAMHEHGQVPHFDIGQAWPPERLLFPDKLYGREQELARLLGAFDRSRQEQGLLCLVSGRSGIGKSRLIEEFRLQSGVQQGYFLSAKFDQYKQTSSLQIIHEAFRPLLLQLLGESEDNLGLWRERLSDALGEQGRALVEVMPELELLLAPQPPLPELPTSETRSRLSRLLTQFIQAFCRPDQPLCLFLDDLQWATPDFYEWLSSILSDVRHLLLIGAYRDHEFFDDGLLFTAVNKAQDNGVGIETITLKPLTLPALAQMLADAMNLEAESAQDLALTVHAKTHGNPFFFIQYIRQLQPDGLLNYEAAGARWQYSLDDIRAAPVSENVVDLMLHRIGSLDETVQDLLKLSACIGNSFDLDWVAALTGDRRRTLQALSVAIDSGLLVKLRTGKEDGRNRYGFSHDRVQQASWSLLTEEQLQRHHLRIGRWLLTQISAAGEKELQFQAVDHLNAARDIIEDADELCRLGAENFKTGLLSKHSGAFEQALPYFRTARELLCADMKPFDGLATLIRQLAECEHLCGHHETAKGFFEEAVTHASSDFEKAQIFEQLIQFYADLAQFDRAYAVSRSAMKLFGIKLPQRFNPLAFGFDFLLLKFRLRNTRPSDLLDLPTVSDARIDIIIRLLSATLKIAYQLQPELCAALSVKLVKQCLRHGNSAEAVIGYMVFGVIFLGGVLENHQAGYDYGRLSLGLLEKFDNQRQKAEVNFVYGYFANSWTHPAADTENYWRTAIAAGLETGDWFHTGCAACAIIQSLFMRGVALNEVWEETEAMAALLRRIDSREHLGAIQGVRQAIRNLQGKTLAKDSFGDEAFNEGEFVEALANFGSRHFAHYYFVNKMQCLYLWGEYEQALALSLESEQYLKDSAGMLHAVEHHFYHAMILAALYGRSKRAVRFRSLRTLRRAEKKLSRWAQRCPENFLGRRDLLRGEIQRLQRRPAQALQCYQDAASAAEKHGHLQIEALANELAARLQADLGHERLARYHFLEASYCYRRWGAEGYLRNFSIGHALAGQDDPTASASIRLSYQEPKTSAAGTELDIDTLIKASETLASERRLSELLQTLMHIVIENAGAQRGVLLLQQGQQLVIQAEADIDAQRVTVLQRLPLAEYKTLPKSVINFVHRTGEAIVLDNAMHSLVYGRDPDIAERRVRSLLCAPLQQRGEIKGLIYLENNAADTVFTNERLSLLRHLSGQIVISIVNAQSYLQLEDKVAERTRHIEAQKITLEEKNNELEVRNARILELNGQLHDEIKEHQRTALDLQKANDELQRHATIDALTQVANRRYFDQRLEQDCQRLQRDRTMLALILCDIDYFKQYNDCYGHQAGDECLQRIAHAIAGALKRPTDFAARYGGEEFAVIMPHTDLNGALQVAESIRHAVAGLQITHQGSLIANTVTLSIGIAHAKPAQRCTPEQMIKAADDALYQVKANGRNGVVHQEMAAQDFIP